jgi:uncharacterized protein (TIGR03435 family)
MAYPLSSLVVGTVAFTTLAFPARSWCQASPPADPRPAFEVASIKPSAPSGHNRSIMMLPGGRFTTTDMSLKDLVAFAYELRAFQVSGGPNWIDTARYDVVATAAGTVNQQSVRAMLQSLLADRFQLAFHREKKELPVYDLVVAKANGKTAPNLTESKQPDCAPPGQPPPPGASNQPPCGGMRMGRNQITAGGVPITMFATGLSNLLGRAVIDKTGLTGKYDIKLDWNPDESQPLLGPGDPTKPPTTDLSGPSIYTAVQEQLGLKLESQKAPLDVLVIDRAEKASEN